MSTSDLGVGALVGRKGPVGGTRWSAYSIVWGLIAAAILFAGFENVILGATLSNNVSAYFIYIAFFSVTAFYGIRLPIFMICLLAYIFIFTFVIHFSPISAGASFIQFIGIGLFSVTVFAFVNNQGNRIERIVNSYYALMVPIAIFTIIQSFAFALFGIKLSLQEYFGGPSLVGDRFRPEIFGTFARAMGPFSEPHHLAMILLPAVYLALLTLVRPVRFLQHQNKVIASCVILALILSFSSLGYLAFACMIGYVAFTSSKRARRVAVLLLVCAVPLGAAISSQIVGGKLKALLSAAAHSQSYNYTTSDLSGFALISNALVARRALSDSHYLGTGLKTHEYSYRKYMPSLFLPQQVLLELNYIDGASLFIRLASEFGAPGVIAFIWFLVRFKLKPGKGASTSRIINDMCFIFLVFQASRDGTYLSVPLWLFMALYYYSYHLGRQEIITGAGSAGSLAAPVGPA